MSSNDFYTAIEDDGKYADVCDYTRKKNRGNKVNKADVDVLDAFSGLQCSGETIHDWKRHSKEYKDNFKRAKLCLQRRITTMKHYPARSAANKTSRRKHIYPIQVAYAYGQDCLKKIASREQQTRFKDSVDALIRKIVVEQPNVAEYFDGSIDNSIRERKDTVRNILNKQYYNDEQMNIINRERLIGYNKLNNNERDKFLSIFNTGLNNASNEVNNGERVAKNISGFKVLENGEDGEGEGEGEGEEEDNGLKHSYYTKIHRDLKTRRNATTKKKSKTIENTTSKLTNISDLNSLLQSGRFEITNVDRRKEVLKRIKELSKLYSDYLLIRSRLFFVEKMYNETFAKFDKLNTEVLSKMSEVSGSQYTKKVLKKSGIDTKYADKLVKFNKRSKLGEKFERLRAQMRDKMSETGREISSKLKTGDKRTNNALGDFFDELIPQYVLHQLSKDLDVMTKSDKDRYLADKLEMYGLETKIKQINTELLLNEENIDENLIKQQNIIKMLESPAIKARANVYSGFKKRLDDLKSEEISLEKTYLIKYDEKTNAIDNILVELGKKYHNPLVLQDFLNSILAHKGAHKNLSIAIREIK